MIITHEIDFADFEPWAGAVDTFARICDAGKCEEFESIIEDMYPRGIGETELNDLLWFDSDWVFEVLNEDEEEDEDEE